jgi:hypothetical protein
MNEKQMSLQFIIHHSAFIIPPRFSSLHFSQAILYIRAGVEKRARARPGPGSSLTSGAREKPLPGHSTSKIKAILFSRKNHRTRFGVAAERRLVNFVFRVKDSPYSPLLMWITTGVLSG